MELLSATDVSEILRARVSAVTQSTWWILYILFSLGERKYPFSNPAIIPHHNKNVLFIVGATYHRLLNETSSHFQTATVTFVFLRSLTRHALLWDGMFTL